MQDIDYAWENVPEMALGIFESMYTEDMHNNPPGNTATAEQILAMQYLAEQDDPDSAAIVQAGRMLWRDRCFSLENAYVLFSKRNPS